MLLAVCHNDDNKFEALSIGGAFKGLHLLVAVVGALTTYYTEFLMLIFTLFIHHKFLLHYALILSNLFYFYCDYHVA